MPQDYEILSASPSIPITRVDHSVSTSTMSVRVRGKRSTTGGPEPTTVGTSRRSLPDGHDDRLLTRQSLQ